MSLFDDNKDPVVIDENKNYLEELVGDGKKFKSPEELAKGKFHADMTVEHMKRELAELKADYLKEREENVTRARLEELIDQLSNKQTITENTQIVDNKPVIDMNEIKSLVTQGYKEQRQAEREEANYNLVVNKLKERYGESYKAVLSKQIDDLDLTAQEVESLAKRNPKMFVKTFGLDQQPKTESFQAPPRTSQRSDSFAPTGEQKRTWNFYQKLKQEKPHIYWEPKTQVQMQQDHINLGSAFEDGDWKAY